MHTFDMCAHRCIFVSYLIGQKEYRVYDLDTKKFFTSRDVFHEHIFPFSISPPKNQLDYPIVPIPLNDFTTSMPSAMVDSLDSPSSLSQVEPPSSMESSIPIESTKISSQHQYPPPSPPLSSPSSLYSIYQSPNSSLRIPSQPCLVA